MEGLEISTVRRSQLNTELRYEAEFFKKCYLAEDSALARWDKLSVGEFADVTDGPHGYHIVDEASPIVMLTAKNAKDWFTDRENADPIAKSVDDSNRRSSLVAGDVILSTRGTVGLCALVTTEVLPANIDQDVARISWAKKRTFLPEYVVAYLNSQYGQDHIARYASGMVQQGLSLQKVRETPVPLLPDKVQLTIANTVQAALSLRRESQELRMQAEQTLLRALGLEGWQPPEPLTYTRYASETFAAGRLDAAHYKEQYYALAARLRDYPYGYTTLGEICPTPVNGVEIRDYHEKGVPYLRVGDLKSFDVDLNSVVKVREADAEALLPKVALRVGDVLVSRSGSLAVIGVVEEEWANAVISSHLIRVRFELQDFDPYYVALFLSSTPGRSQIEQRSNGGVQPEINQPSLKSILLPKLAREAQKKIRAYVQQSRKARLNARELLERAKRAVEIAIEQSEAAALRYLDQRPE